MKDNKDEFIDIDTQSAEYDDLFKDAPTYEKYAIVRARQAVAGEVIVTTIHSDKGAFEETKNTAKEGDVIVTNPGGEEYIINKEKFSKLYLALPDGTFKAIGKVKAIRINKNVSFIAPWGEKMNLTAGGYLVENGADRYGIEENVFKDTYRLKQPPLL